MKNRKNSILGSLGLGIVSLLALSIYLFKSTQKEYSYITFAVMVILIILLIIYLYSTKSEAEKFRSQLKYILKTFDSVLAYIDSEIDFANKEIIKLETFDDLVNCQEEMKKPILYKCTDNTAIFLLIDKDLIYYNVLKENKDLVDPMEEKMISDKNKENEKKNEKNNEPDESLLDGIDKTTIIKLKDNKKYKVSPVRKKSREEMQKEEFDRQMMAYVKDNVFPKMKEKKKNNK